MPDNTLTPDPDLANVDNPEINPVRPPLVRPGAFKEVSLPETEDLDNQNDFIDSIFQKLISADPQDIESGKNQVRGLHEFLRSTHPENFETVIKENLVKKLTDYLNANPEFKDKFVEILKLLVFAFVTYERPLESSHLASEVLNQIAISIEPIELQNEINDSIPQLIIDASLDATYLHGILNVLSELNSEIIISQLYKLIFSELIKLENPVFEVTRLMNLVADAFIESLRQIQDAPEIISFLMLIDQTDRIEVFNSSLKRRLTNVENKSLFISRSRKLIFKELESDKKAYFIEKIIGIGSIDLILEVVQAPSNLEDESVRETFELLLQFVSKLIEKGTPEDISKLFSFVGQLALRIDFLKPEWKDISINILILFNEYHQNENETVKLALNEVLVTSVTSKIVNSLKVTLRAGSDEANEISKDFFKIIIIDRFSIFSEEQRIEVYKSIIESNNKTYIELIHTYLSRGEYELEEIISGNQEFYTDHEIKLQMVIEFERGLQLGITQKKQIIDDYVTGRKGSKLIFIIVLRDDEALEYYRELIFGLKEKKLGTNKIEQELEDIKINIIDTLDIEKRTKRLESKLENVSQRWQVRLLVLFSRSEVSKRQKKREIAQKEVTEADSSNIQNGLNNLLGIAESPEKSEELIRAIVSNPQSYAIIVNIIEELFQNKDRLNLEGNAQKTLSRILRLLLGNNALMIQMPEHIRVLKLEMWKDRLDEFEDTNSQYGKAKAEILTKRGQPVNLDSLKKREKKKYESKLAKKFLALSSPRGECLSEIISLYQNDKSLFNTLIGQAEFIDVIEYAIDQYKKYPDQFLQISDTEREFLLFLMTNKDVWSQIGNRVKFKISEQVLLLWSKEDASGFDILNILLEERNEEVDYSFIHNDILDFIGAVFQQMPPEVRSKLVGFAKLNEKKTRLQRAIDMVRRSESSEYADNLNYLVSYLATRNRINAKEHYAIVDIAMQEAAVLGDQVVQENQVLEANQKLEEYASGINSSGELLTTERAEELKPKLDRSFGAVVVFIEGFKMDPPLTFREQDEVLEMIPKLIDLLIYATQTETNADNITKVLEFLQKLLKQNNPDYFKPSRVYIELLEDIDTQFKQYASITSGDRFTTLNLQLTGLRAECEVRALAGVNSVFINTLSTLQTPIIIKADKSMDFDSRRVLRPHAILRAIKPSIELLYSHPDLVRAMIKSSDANLQRNLSTQLGRLLVYINLYINDVALVKKLEYFITETALCLDKDLQKNVVAVHADCVEKIKVIKNSKRRVLPSNIKRNLIKLAA